MKRKLLFILAALLMAATTVKADNVLYAVLSDDNKILTLNCADEAPEGTVLFTGNSNWAKDFRSSVTTVIIEESCDKYNGNTLVCLFYNFYNLNSITGLPNLNTSMVTSMSSMFMYCSKLTSLDLSTFDTRNVTNMGYMFDGCSKLTSLDLSGFDTSNVTNINYMFRNCKLTSLDISMFNITKVNEMYGVFRYCSQLTTLDLSGFNTTNATIMKYLFDGCQALKSIIVDSNKWKTDNVTSSNSENLFLNCTALVGEDGTTYNSSSVDKENAHTGDGGYLTEKTVSVSANEAEGSYWTTYYKSSVNRQADATTTVYAATRNDRTLTLVPVNDGIIKAGQGVILKKYDEDNPNNANITLTSVATAADDTYYEGNVLTGVDKATTRPVKLTEEYYVLSKKNEKLAFYNYTGTTLGANKAYFSVRFGSLAAPAMFPLGFGDAEGATAISGTELKPADEASDAAYHTLDGRRLTARPAQKGIYITGGKKVVIK